MSVCPSGSISHLLKISSGNPYLKICDLIQYSFADAPMKNKNIALGINIFLVAYLLMLYQMLLKTVTACGQIFEHKKIVSNQEATP